MEKNRTKYEQKYVFHTSKHKISHYETTTSNIQINTNKSIEQFFSVTLKIAFLP